MLGCLVEKRMSTPDQYPLTVNALLNACNQSTNRSPVVRYEEHTVTEALTHLRELGLTRIVYSTSNRAPKHRHVLDEELGLDPGELAVLAVLALRGPQTAGELKLRTERMHPFATVEDVEVTLAGLSTGDDPLTVRLPRRPGQKEARHAHLLAGPVDVELLAEADGAEGPPGRHRRAAADERIEALEARIEALEDVVAQLRTLLD